jgi:hypothetical protein
MWRYMPTIPALGRLRQKDHEFEARVRYTSRTCLRNKRIRLIL